MTYEAKSPEEYIEQLPADRKDAVEKLRKVVKENLPDVFEEIISYGMIGYVVPKSIYPSGYHANPKEPLPFMGIASQKNHIALYHMAIQGFPDLQAWFSEEYARKVKTKLDMGIGCIRFRNTQSIPYDIIAELCKKISPEDYIIKYEASVKARKKNE